MQTVASYAEIDLDKHIFFNIAAEVNQLIQPLITYFGLDKFNYHKTYNDDSQIQLTNTPEWKKHYVRNKLYQQSIFELSAHNYSKSRIIWSNIDTHNVILQEAAKFEIWHGVTLIEPREDGCEFYFLGTTIDNRRVINNYLSNFYLIEKFIANFHNAAAKLFAKVEPHRLKVLDWQQNTLQYKNYKLIDRFIFLAAVYGYSFTKREFDCIPLLLKGQSSKQIAERLQISFRTVEVYIDNLKEKTKCNTKNELLMLLSEKFT